MTDLLATILVVTRKTARFDGPRILALSRRVSGLVMGTEAVWRAEATGAATSEACGA